MVRRAGTGAEQRAGWVLTVLASMQLVHGGEVGDDIELDSEGVHLQRELARCLCQLRVGLLALQRRDRLLAERDLLAVHLQLMRRIEKAREREEGREGTVSGERSRGSGAGEDAARTPPRSREEPTPGSEAAPGGARGRGGVIGDPKADGATSFSSGEVLASPSSFPRGASFSDSPVFVVERLPREALWKNPWLTTSSMVASSPWPR